ncbi:MAG: hypothetical protein ACPGVB_13570 [Chitinophagales bacterium]
MKKTILSQLTNLKGVQSLSEERLHTLKGGCSDGSARAAYTYKHDDDKYGDENGCTSGGEEGFIPPPGT